MKIKTVFLLTLLTISAHPALADEEPPKRAHVVADVYGQCYAKSVPGPSTGQQEGSTRVYKVEETEDRLLYTLPWYSNEFYMQCQAVGNAKVSIVRIGPDHRGQYASANDLALAFYYNGTLVRRYSTLEIAGKAGNVTITKSHYIVLRQEGWSGQHHGLFLAFRIETQDNRLMTFDPVTGKILSTERMTHQ